MAEQHIQSKLITMLKQDKIQLWNPPYTTDTNDAGRKELQVRSFIEKSVYQHLFRFISWLNMFYTHSSFYQLILPWS